MAQCKCEGMHGGMMCEVKAATRVGATVEETAVVDTRNWRQSKVVKVKGHAASLRVVKVTGLAPP